MNLVGFYPVSTDGSNTAVDFPRHRRCLHA